MIVWCFSFGLGVSFLLWSGQDLDTWLVERSVAKTGVYKELGSGPPRNSWLCPLAPPRP